MKIYVLIKEETFFEDGEALETVITPISYHKTKEGALVAAKKLAPKNSSDLKWVDEMDNIDIQLTVKEAELQD
ncbi:MAG: hypothetical protein D8H99_02500 [Streptococcus sp.]|nr:MAG: hypothetical protein D8H99_02500 [Streptococcus sp.]